MTPKLRRALAFLALGLAWRPSAASAGPVELSLPVAPAAAAGGAVEGVFAPLKAAEPGLPALPDLSALPAVPLEGPEARQAALAAHEDGSAQALVAYTQTRARALLALRGKPLQEKIHNPGGHHADMIDIKGVPERIRAYPPDGVFRHYTDREGLDAILKTGRLNAGYVSYIEKSPGLWEKVYTDLSGICLTLPGVDADDVGRKDSREYVDFKLPQGTAVLELEEGRIFLVPMPGRYRGWMKDVYERSRRGEEPSGPYQELIQETEARGGLPPDMSLPIEIVGRSRP